jgi:hypothetical protein
VDAASLSAVRGGVAALPDLDGWSQAASINAANDAAANADK